MTCWSNLGRNRPHVLNVLRHPGDGGVFEVGWLGSSYHGKLIGIGIRLNRFVATNRITRPAWGDELDDASEYQDDGTYDLDRSSTEEVFVEEDSEV